MSDVAIRVEGLGKRFRIGPAARPRTMLRDLIASTASRAWERLRHPQRASQPAPEFWALRDVGFEVRTGEILGVVGNNGAGKSTLLRILAGITEPTEGHAWMYGRVASLLELGTGFNSELSGRDNIFLSGALLGMARSDVIRRFDEIVEFSGIAGFLDTPVKHYSSGMYMRLAFSVAAHLETDILIVDEVLAVGDVSFQQKCLVRMDRAMDEGRTVIFVSHDLDSVLRLCPRALLLSDGRVAALGPTARVLADYLAQRREDGQPGSWIDLSRHARTGTGEARFEAVRFESGQQAFGGNVQTYGPLRLTFRISSERDMVVPSLSIKLRHPAGIRLLHADTSAFEADLRLKRGENLVSVEIAALYVNPGEYSVDVALGPLTGPRLDSREAAFVLPVVNTLGITVSSSGSIPYVIRVLEPAGAHLPDPPLQG